VRSSRSLVAVLAIAVLVGATLVGEEPGRSNPLWTLWASLALALCVTQGVVFVYGVRRWNDLRTLQPISFGDVAVVTAVTTTISLAVINLTVLYPGPEDVNWQNGVLLSMAVLTGDPRGQSCWA
jgi:hypothetical protein